MLDGQMELFAGVCPRPLTSGLVQGHLPAQGWSSFSASSVLGSHRVPVASPCDPSLPTVGAGGMAGLL